MTAAPVRWQSLKLKVLQGEVNLGEVPTSLLFFFFALTQDDQVIIYTTHCEHFYHLYGERGECESQFP